MAHHVVRSLLGLVFLVAGTFKLMDLAAFASNLGDFGIVLDSLVPVAAWFICLAEILIGIGLLASVRWSLFAAVTLLILFVVVLSYGVALGLDIDCGCLGPVWSVDLKTQLLIDIGLLGWCGLVFVTGRRRRREETGAQAAREVVVPEGEA